MARRFMASPPNRAEIAANAETAGFALVRNRKENGRRVFKRMSSVFQQKVNSALDRAEDPQQALDFSYEKQLEALQQVRRNVADVLTSEKRLELQAAQLKQNQTKLQGQAESALQQGREDIARLALTRAQEAQAQLAGLSQQI